ncbi:MAG: hypothetical protein HY661_07540 [Betaproteobacteria bacterium]|nr:hypothetical protein [Betaproteobacteria bacterium]
MPERISKAHHEYAGRQLHPGDRFNVEPQDLELLLLLQRIEPEEPDEYQTRDMAAAPPAAYRTRDMSPRKRKHKTLQA